MLNFLFTALSLAMGVKAVKDTNKLREELRRRKILFDETPVPSPAKPIPDTPVETPAPDRSQVHLGEIHHLFERLRRNCTFLQAEQLGITDGTSLDRYVLGVFGGNISLNHDFWTDIKDIGQVIVTPDNVIIKESQDERYTRLYPDNGHVRMQAYDASTPSKKLMLFNTWLQQKLLAAVGRDIPPAIVDFRISDTQRYQALLGRFLDVTANIVTIPYDSGWGEPSENSGIPPGQYDRFFFSLTHPIRYITPRCAIVVCWSNGTELQVLWVDKREPSEMGYCSQTLIPEPNEVDGIAYKTSRLRLDNCSACNALTEYERHLNDLIKALAAPCMAAVKEAHHAHPRREALQGVKDLFTRMTQRLSQSMLEINPNEVRLEAVDLLDEDWRLRHRVGLNSWLQFDVRQKAAIVVIDNVVNVIVEDKPAALYHRLWMVDGAVHHETYSVEPNTAHPALLLKLLDRMFEIWELPKEEEVEPQPVTTREPGSLLARLRKQLEQTALTEQFAYQFMTYPRLPYRKEFGNAASNWAGLIQWLRNSPAARSIVNDLPCTVIDPEKTTVAVVGRRMGDIVVVYSPTDETHLRVVDSQGVPKEQRDLVKEALDSFQFVRQYHDSNPEPADSEEDDLPEAPEPSLDNLQQRFKAAFHEGTSVTYPKAFGDTPADWEAVLDWVIEFTAHPEELSLFDVNGQVAVVSKCQGNLAVVFWGTDGHLFMATATNSHGSFSLAQVERALQWRLEQIGESLPATAVPKGMDVKATNPLAFTDLFLRMRRITVESVGETPAIQWRKFLGYVRDNPNENGLADNVPVAAEALGDMKALVGLIRGQWTIVYYDTNGKLTMAYYDHNGTRYVSTRTRLVEQTLAYFRRQHQLNELLAK